MRIYDKWPSGGCWVHPGAALGILREKGYLVGSLDRTGRVPMELWAALRCAEIAREHGIHVDDHRTVIRER